LINYKKVPGGKCCTFLCIPKVGRKKGRIRALEIFRASGFKGVADHLPVNCAGGKTKGGLLLGLWQLRPNAYWQMNNWALDSDTSYRGPWTYSKKMMRAILLLNSVRMSQT